MEEENRGEGLPRFIRKTAVDMKVVAGVLINCLLFLNLIINLKLHFQLCLLQRFSYKDTRLTASFPGQTG